MFSGMTGIVWVHGCLFSNSPFLFLCSNDLAGAAGRGDVAHCSCGEISLIGFAN